MSGVIDYVTTLDRNQLIVHASVALAAVLGVRKIFGGSDEYRKMIEQQKKLQSVPISDALPGEGPIYRRAEYKDKLYETWDPKITTAYEMFNETLAKYPNRPFLGARKKNKDTVGDYEWQTFAEIGKRRDNFGSGLIRLGHKFEEPVGIYAINRPEWLITDYACTAYKSPSVALYDTLGQNAVEFIIRHAEIKVVVCAGKQLPNILNVAASCRGILKRIVCMDSFTEEQREAARKADVALSTFKEVEDLGASNPCPHVPPRSEDIYTIMYTSGTTGDPKGVLLSHGNLVAEITGIRMHEKDKLFNEDDIHMSYLPLAHSFERATVYGMLSYGSQIGFYQGNIVELFNDIATLRPTFLVGAPRVWSRLYDKLLMNVNTGSPLKKQLFHWGFAAKQKALQSGQSTPFWDKILFSKTKARLGGRVKFILSGSAPLDPKLGEFLKICFCCDVVEGYGLTENFAGALITAIDETKFGHVGKPLSCVEVKLLDVPEMGYSSKNSPACGEIMIRGPNIFKGYFKDPEKTKEALEADGFFHTGDIGRWNANGTLSIIDRKKNIFKLSQGEYVAVEYLEGVYIRSPLVAQIWVYGNSFKRYLVAVVVPDVEGLSLWAKQNGYTTTEVKDLIKDEKVKQAIFDDLTKVAKDSKLHGFEYVKSIHLTAEPFSVDNDLMTPTFKLRRPNLIKYYKKEIDDMYEKIGESD